MEMEHNFAVNLLDVINLKKEKNDYLLTILKRYGKAFVCAVQKQHTL